MLSLAIIFILLMCCSAFFSSSETALFSLSQVQVHQFSEKGGRSGKKLLALLMKPRDTLVTILLGNELVNVSISIVGAAIISRTIRLGVESQTFLAVAIITPIIMIFCEIVPKNIALRFASPLAKKFVYPIHIFYRLIKPIRIILTAIAGRMLRLFRGTTEEEGLMIMEEEYRRLVDMGRKGGAIEEEEREIIHKVFEFTDKRAGNIMTPVERIFALPIDMPYERLMEEIRSTQFSRVPFYEGSRSNFIGILHVRDLFSFNMRRAAGEDAQLRSLLREPLFVKQNAPLEDVLKEFQKGRMHMALVMDDAGKFMGLVTMDDVLEELFGEIEE
ncbi:MAG: hemolysin family protein [Pseudomonadota bacterium]